MESGVMPPQSKRRASWVVGGGQASDVWGFQDRRSEIGATCDARPAACGLRHTSQGGRWECGVRRHVSALGSAGERGGRGERASGVGGRGDGEWKAASCRRSPRGVRRGSWEGGRRLRSGVSKVGDRRSGRPATHDRRLAAFDTLAKGGDGSVECGDMSPLWVRRGSEEGVGWVFRGSGAKGWL